MALPAAESQDRPGVGRHQESLELLRQASEIEPSWAEPHYSAGVTSICCTATPTPSRASIALFNWTPAPSRSLFLYSAALANQGAPRGRGSPAPRHRSRAVTWHVCTIHLGASGLRDNRAAEANRRFKKAIQLKPDYAPPITQLASCWRVPTSPAGCSGTGSCVR